MNLEQHTLQLLRQRFDTLLPWFCSQTKANVTIATGSLDYFMLVAAWEGGSHRKKYDVVLIRGLGRRGCARKFAEDFVNEVRRARGEEVDDE